MNDAIRSGLIAALALFAVALSAATLGSTVTTDGDGPSGTGDGGGGGDGEGGPLPEPESGSPAETVVAPYLAELLTVLVVLIALVVVVYALVYRREAAKVIIGMALLIGLAYLLFRFVAGVGGEMAPPLEPGEGTPFGGDGEGEATDGDDPTGPSLPAALAVLVLVLTLVGGVIALLGRSDASEEAGSEDAEAGPDTADAAAVGRAAGRAADRVENRGTENEVYRAWREMTGLLDAPDPEARTPGEFADRAVAAGISEEDVDELTRLFEDVRYGERTVSEEYERRAVETFRRIERRYAEGGS
ncbi:DUF4129 domain-containing protein [Halalkalicoccus tibetensis]|uniref:DUF4129 domain-containing protein n=1 Tax=Halalkalicoccus tibetensis TaxID=175632 RepID=A0ABD5V563_9EURY